MFRIQVSAAMIMTAGLGTRLSPFTKLQTKALMPVLGIPVVQYLIDTLRVSGVNRIVANVHHLADQTQRQLRELDLSGAELWVSDEGGQLLGTAGGIRKALPLLGSGPFIRASADVICDLDWQALLQRHVELREKKGVLMTLALLKNPHQGEHYPEILMDPAAELVTGVGVSAPRGFFWTGAAILEREALQEVPPEGPSEFVPFILKPAMAEKKAGVYLSDASWIDMGSPHLWQDAHFQLLQALERESDSNPLFSRWRQRILEVNHQISPGIWMKKGSLISSQMRIHAPAYLSSWGAHELKYQELGPRSAVYGDRISRKILKNGIGYEEFWVGDE